MDQISTKELLSYIDNSNVKIIDVRSVNAYNGWKEQNEIRGGHIRNAKSIPVKWTKYIDWIEIVRSKNIIPSDLLIIYGYERKLSEKVAKLFIKAGYPNVKIYNDFLNEWCPKKDFPMDKLERYRHLVSAEWLNELMQKGTAPNFNSNKYVICHAHYRNKEDYKKGHIPGAVELDTNLLESPDTWNRRSPESIEKALKNIGITNDTSVVLYGRFSYPDNNDPFPGSSAGHLGAIRCAFIMLYAGVRDVRILNGGIQSWIDAGFEITTEETKKQGVNIFGNKIPLNPDLAVDLEEAKNIIHAKDANLVCVRSWNEYIGEVSGYNYIKKKGRIPGALFADCGSDAYHMENYRNLDHTMREYHEIMEIWENSGITPDKHNAFYCGTGWRASEAFFNAWLMGWPRISVFDGGWFEWSNNNCPIETGLPNNK